MKKLTQKVKKKIHRTWDLYCEECYMRADYILEALEQGGELAARYMQNKEEEIFILTAIIREGVVYLDDEVNYPRGEWDVIMKMLETGTDPSQIEDDDDDPLWKEAEENDAPEDVVNALKTRTNTAPPTLEKTETIPSASSTYAEDITAAAIVAGWKIDFEKTPTEDDYEQLAELLGEINHDHKISLGLYVPGDTINGSDYLPESFIIGQKVVLCDTYEGAIPSEVTLPKVEQVINQLPKIDHSIFAQKLQSLPTAISHISKTTGTYLISWGPLCYGALHIGKEANRNDTIHYKYATVQDYNQGQGDLGIDGVYLTSVEFSDIQALEWSDKKHEEDRVAIPKIDAPKYYLIARYD